MTVDYRTADFEGVGEFACLHCEFFREKGELLYFLKRCESFLQCFDTVAYQLAYTRVGKQLVKVAVTDFFPAGIFFQGFDCRHYDCCDEFEEREE